MLIETLKPKLKKSPHDTRYQSVWQFIHIDFMLFCFVGLLCAVGLFILYSASNRNFHELELQAIHLLLALGVMFVFAQVSPVTLRRWAPFVYGIGLFMLLLVLLFGHVGKGAQRWINTGFMRFQPSELMKLALPLMLAWYYHRIHLPITFKNVMVSLPIILIPVGLVVKQPDLSTAILLCIASASVLFFAGLSWRFITSMLLLIASFIPFTWYLLHDYQRQRVLTFLNPERDPLGSGYHIIQSKIAIGSGGLFGKGWMNGTQSNLQFLPEHSTDFIFAVCGEELGFVGSISLIAIYMFIVLRGLYITINAQDTFSRLVAGSITLTFFVTFFINMGMVTGIFPVAGIPLLLVSYGGSSMMTIMASFGILMSIQTHRKLVTT